MTLHEMYVIKWRDHFSTEGFFDLDLDDVNLEMELTSLGFFIKEDEHYYHFARTLGDDMCADLMSIIKEQIIAIEEINL